MNAFDELVFDSFPAVHPGFDVMVVMSDLLSLEEIGIELEIVDFRRELDDAANAVVWYDMIGIEGTSQLKKEWIRFRTGQVTFRQPGIHEIRVLLNGRILETGTLQVRTG
ncbi:MAG: hypothetical protein KDB82_16545 [Planctomycetes bacterium]|nr:hypothetical protein [Planctomycetota bacterium]